VDDELLDVNCGRCGRRLVLRIGDLRDKWTVECADCETMVGRRESEFSLPISNSVFRNLRLFRRGGFYRRDPF
jgi:endogenous inhibitor of DNA gyrase (YacG/DUF329 family)